MLSLAVSDVAFELLVMHFDAFGDLFDVGPELLDENLCLMKAVVDLFEPLVDFLEASGHLAEAVFNDRRQLVYFHAAEGTSVQVTSQRFYCVWNQTSFRYFGSSASISPSPRKFRPITAAMIAAPGKMVR